MHVKEPKLGPEHQRDCKREHFVRATKSKRGQGRTAEGDEVSERIIADQQRAESLGVSRTPTLFINGRVLPPTSYQEAGLRSAIQNALEGKTPAPSATLSPTP